MRFFTNENKDDRDDAKDVDLIVCATSTPDYTFPSTASQIQMGLGIHHGAAFDVQAVCTGFIYAVSTADKFLRSGSHKRALVVGAGASFPPGAGPGFLCAAAAAHALLFLYAAQITSDAWRRTSNDAACGS